MKTCVVVGCTEDRMPDALVCREHMGDLFHNRLDRTPEGFVPVWLRRGRDPVGTGATMQQGKDLTGGLAA